MSTQEYIQTERKQIKEDCERLRITPLEWVERFAKIYHDQNAHRLNLCRSLDKRVCS